MHHFAYKDGVLHAEDVPLPRLADEVGTPFYCYSTATLERHYRVLAEAFAGQDAVICFAVKANSNQAVLATMARLGAGMDVVSEGELRRARAAGVAADKIIFAGVGKSRAEMAYALGEGIFGFNVESEAELSALSEVAQSLGATARVALRVNPDVDAKTHAKISTGKSENKFGIPYLRAASLYAEARRLPALDVSGIHMHIGSQITDLAPFRDAFLLMRDLALELRRAGHAIHHLDIGGGLGVPYRGSNDVPPHPDEYARLVKETLGDLEATIYLEPGRMITGNAGILVASVLYAKDGAGKRFTIVDAAMNDLIRPTLYEAYHEVWPVDGSRAGPLALQDIVGPVCETGDYLALERELPAFAEGDLIAVMTAGAYGAVMSSTYNTRLLVPEVLVRGGDYAVVRPRPSFDDLIGLDRLPPWLASS
ncbi:MAG: diaminopimelate decarboxylase [Hyphomicrobium sp.]|uniref:diaminopimelate decarboxylase n=1 Tax=Hyphomicrobium sp. TaxID=82 RepID=UPI003D0EC3C1